MSPTRFGAPGSAFARRAAAILAALLPPSPSPAAAQAPGPDSVIYELSRASRLDVHTGRAGVFAGLGHEHLVRAGVFDGVIVYFPGAPERSRVAITVLAESLAILTDAKPRDIAKMTRAMREETLRVTEYPEIRLASREVTATADGFRVTGDFTLVGHTRPITADVALSVTSDTLRAVARFSLRQTDFGIKPYSTAFGTVKVADEVRFELGVVATARR